WDRAFPDPRRSGNFVFEKLFGRSVGREGERIVRVVVVKATGKIITDFPEHTFKALALLGTTALTLFASRAAEAAERGEAWRGQTPTTSWTEDLIYTLLGSAYFDLTPSVIASDPIGQIVNPMYDKLISDIQESTQHTLGVEERRSIWQGVYNAFAGGT